MAAAPIQLYAELLTNIRHVSISVTLASPINDSTVVELLPPRDDAQSNARLRVRHDGAAQEMTLPGRVAVAMAARPVRLPLPSAASLSNKQGDAVPPRYLTWRLPVAGDAGKPAGGVDDDDDELVPWSAPDLVPLSAVACRACSTPVVAADRIRAWKDLPSDNWAEMMEFWHCHKPAQPPQEQPPQEQQTEQATEEALAARGYGASSVISAEAGVGFVDLTTLLFAPSDCHVSYSESTFDKSSTDRAAVLAARDKGNADAGDTRRPRGLNVFCTSCSAQIGYCSLRAPSVTLFKWKVACASVSASAAAPTVTDCVAATLVATMARTGSSKSVLLPVHDAPDVNDQSGKSVNDDVLQVWVLNSSICFASDRHPTPTRAIKLLYKTVGRAAADDLAAQLSSDVQEINLPGETIRAVALQLAASSGLLPAGERVFKEWTIGLMARWAGSAE